MDIFPSLHLSFQLSSRPQGRLLRHCRHRCREAPARRPIRARLANAGQELLVRVYLLGPVAIESSAYTRAAGGPPVGRPHHATYRRGGSLRADGDLRAAAAAIHTTSTAGADPRHDRHVAL